VAGESLNGSELGFPVPPLYDISTLAERAGNLLFEFCDMLGGAFLFNLTSEFKGELDGVDVLADNVPGCVVGASASPECGDVSNIPAFLRERLGNRVICILAL